MSLTSLLEGNVASVYKSHSHSLVRRLQIGKNRIVLVRLLYYVDKILFIYYFVFLFKRMNLSTFRADSNIFLFCFHSKLSVASKKIKGWYHKGTLEKEISDSWRERFCWWCITCFAFSGCFVYIWHILDVIFFLLFSWFLIFSNSNSFCFIYSAIIWRKRIWCGR